MSLKKEKSSYSVSSLSLRRRQYKLFIFSCTKAMRGLRSTVSSCVAKMPWFVLKASTYSKKQTNKLKIKFLKLKAKIIFEQKKKKITRSTTSNHRCKSSASVYSLYGIFYNFSKTAWSESRPFLSVVFIRVMLRSSVSLLASSCLVFLSTFITNEICRLNLW